MNSESRKECKCSGCPLRVPQGEMVRVIWQGEAFRFCTRMCLLQWLASDLMVAAGDEE